MPSGHYLRTEPAYLEFTGFQRGRDVADHTLQPAEMAWSIAEIDKKWNMAGQPLREGFDRLLKERQDALENEF